MTAIEKIIKKREVDYLVFKPDRSFYRTVGINQKRWGQIYRGKTEPLVSELRAIALFFNVEVTELMQ